MVKPTKTTKQSRLVPIALIVSGMIGLAASFALAVETINYIKDPEQALACSINPIVNCSSVIDTPQGEILGFMNPLIGIIAFSMLIVFGLAVLCKAKFPNFIWMSAQAVSISAVIFVHWLIYNSIYVLGSLCPYCMVTWVVTISTAVYVTIHNLSAGLFGVKGKKIGGYLFKYHPHLLAVWYTLIIALIINHFGIANLTA